jgi:archaellum component FlaF (FlaF/FlaG flagellin family)
MERNVWSGLASRLVIFGLVALLIFWAMPGSGVSAMRKMNASMQNARSWRVQTVVTEPTKNIESTTEVYCPSRVHTVSKTVMDEGGRHYEENSENIWIEGTNYAKKGLRWVTSQEERSRTASCAWGPLGTDTLLQSLDAVLVAGKIRKGDKRIVNGERCRDWIASVPAPAGWRDEFVVCIGEGELPREVFTPDRRLVETYTDWNAAIRIEAPPEDELNPK